MQRENERNGEVDFDLFDLSWGKGKNTVSKKNN